MNDAIRDMLSAYDLSTVASATDDVIRFLPHPANVSIWAKEFFMAVAEKVRFV